MTVAITNTNPTIRMRFELMNVDSKDWTESDYPTDGGTQCTTYAGKEQEVNWRTSGGALIKAHAGKSLAFTTMFEMGSDKYNDGFACSYPPSTVSHLSARLGLPKFRSVVTEFDFLCMEWERDRSKPAVTVQQRPAYKAMPVTWAWSECPEVSVELARALLFAHVDQVSACRTAVWLDVSLADYAAIRAVESKVEAVADFNLHADVYNRFAAVRWNEAREVLDEAPCPEAYIASRIAPKIVRPVFSNVHS